MHYISTYLVQEFNPSVWACLVRGAADTWPKGMPFGGIPAQINVSFLAYVQARHRLFVD
jgi:hypothetical protein